MPFTAMCSVGEHNCKVFGPCNDSVVTYFCKLTCCQWLSDFVNMVMLLLKGMGLQILLFQMVVVSGGWVKSVVYPNSGDVIAISKMAAKAVLICRPNSHPFQVIILAELLR